MSIENKREKLRIPSKEDRRLEAAEFDIANVLFESMSDKLKLAQVEVDLGNALVEIMTIKMEASA